MRNTAYPACLGLMLHNSWAPVVAFNLVLARSLAGGGTAMDGFCGSGRADRGGVTSRRA